MTRKGGAQTAASWCACGRGEGAMLPVFATALLFAIVGPRWLAILPDVTLSSFAFAGCSA